MGALTGVMASKEDLGQRAGRPQRGPARWRASRNRQTRQPAPGYCVARADSRSANRQLKRTSRGDGFVETQFDRGQHDVLLVVVKKTLAKSSNYRATTLRADIVIPTHDSTRVYSATNRTTDEPLLLYVRFFAVTSSYQVRVNRRCGLYAS